MTRSVYWRWTVGFVGVLLIAFLPMWIAAEEEASDVGSPHPATGLLVLKSGRIVEGTLSQNAGGFVVEKSRGSMLIPFEQVQLRASDLRDAYQKLRKTFPEQSAEAHVALARWCLTYQLFDECRAELRAALTTQPDHREARSMLRRLDEVLHPEEPTHLTLPKPEPRTEDGFQTPKATSLAGLSRESAREFVTRIQPILLNNCGNAGCHGNGRDTGYRLTHRALGRSGHRVFAERNLAQTLAFVDARHPETSPLLVVLVGNHGRGGQPVFQGRRAADQQKTLQKWVFDVAAELQAGPSVTADNPSSLRPLGPTLGEATPSSGAPRPAATQSVGELRFDAERRNEEKTADPGSGHDDLLEAILRDERPDAFDPEIFNRLVHGTKSKDADQR